MSQRGSAPLYRRCFDDIDARIQKEFGMSSVLLGFPGPESQVL